MKRLLILCVAGAACSAILAAPAAANHSWNNYHWARTVNPFTINVGDNVTGDWDAHLRAANADWSTPTDETAPDDPAPVGPAADVLDLSTVPGTSNKRCAMVRGTVQACNGKYGNNGWLGIATINLSGGHITQGSAKMNDTYFTTATYNNPNEKLHVMCQEIGHTFGLGHTSEDGSSQNTCMDYFSNTGTAAGSTDSTRPNRHDYDQLAAIYGHVDATTTLASSPASSPGMAGRADAQPYRSERHDHGKHSELREHFADGTIRVTDVRWVDGPQAVIHRG